MYRMDIYTTVKTLLQQGKSQRQIALALGIHRKVVKRIERSLDGDKEQSGYQRDHKLEAYRSTIEGYLENKLSAELIHKKLLHNESLQVSYSTVCRFLQRLQSTQTAYVPMESAPGKEAQVDFGYLGTFDCKDGRQVKVWVFCMVLSYSRLGYFEAVTNQSLESFIHCHIHAFDYFGGAPQEVRLDNLKAGVTSPDFFEPLIQEQYASFLSHYGAAAIPCRVRTPQHKGKVESSVKYVKNNFLRSLDHCSWEQLNHDLTTWTSTVANQRTHGTTKRVPYEQWQQSEREELQPLPAQRYKFYHVEERKVSRFGHITFRSNYYSVPYDLVGHTLRLFSDGTLLRISYQDKEVAMHCILKDKGKFVTQTSHLHPKKQPHSPEYFMEQLEAKIGPPAVALMRTMQEQHASHWRDKVRGLLSLSGQHPKERLIEACQLALDNRLSTYRSVRDICIMLEKNGSAGVYFQSPVAAGGMGHNLSIYDQLTRQDKA